MTSKVYRAACFVKELTQRGSALNNENTLNGECSIVTGLIR
ncbi:MAG: hypothetical protein ACLQDF_05940 [Desulfomonilia bacterium]